MRGSLVLAMLVAASNGCSRSAVVVDPECSEHHESEYRSLYEAQFLSVPPHADWLPPEILALRCIVREPDAVARLIELSQRGTLPGQVYALVGLRVLDEAEFERIVPRYKSNSASITFDGGDLSYSRTVSLLAQDIESWGFIPAYLPEMKDRIPPGGAYWITDAPTESPERDRSD
jgi:hypothetical protein